MEKKDYTKLTAQQLVHLFKFKESGMVYDNCVDSTSASLYDLRSKYYSECSENRIEEGDWIAVKDTLKKQLDAAADPVYANILGEIYCYGRCSDGQPDYEKAIFYYMMGAVGGVYESAYKLSDLIMHGNGAGKNKVFAKDLITEAYTKSLDDFLKGDYSGQFADAAIRMGHITRYSDDDGFEKYRLGYKYYLQSRYALKQRMKVCDYSDEIFLSRLNNSLQAVDAAYPEIFHKKAASYTCLSDILCGSFSEGRRLELKVKRMDSMCYELNFRILPDGFKDNSKLFITIPETNYCGMKTELKIMFHPSAKGKKLKEGSYIFDSLNQNSIFYFRKEVLELNGLFNI